MTERGKTGFPESPDGERDGIDVSSNMQQLYYF
jgi:hypothetical protein